VDKKAQIAQGVRIGPYCVIGPDVKIGKDTQLHSQVVIDGRTTIGERNLIFSCACLGSAPQIKAFRDVEKSILIIGNDNVFREHVTVTAGSSENSPTRIGDRNMLMIQTHVGHDVIMGNDITMANAVGLSGHVVVEDCVVFGGIGGVHQFVRIGRLSMVGGFSRVTKDIPPYSLCTGIPIRLYGVNSVGLKRAGYSSQQTTAIRKAMRILLRRGSLRSEAIARIREEFKGNPDIEHLVTFCEKSKRGICRLSSDAPEGDGVERGEV
jgi:UDP-N-acetylglucosamine acyltransferase